MISHKHKAIFVHIPKSAGTSVGTALSVYSDGDDWGMQDHRAIRHLSPISALEARNFFSRTNYEIIYRRLRDQLILHRQYPTKEQFASYYKFTFVRNSWARVYSWYTNVMDDQRHMSRYRIPENASFKWFVDNRLSTLKDQLYYITDANGAIGVDFIGRYENLAADYAEVCTALGIRDSSLPNRNRSIVPGHIEHYDDYLINVVRQRYAKDVEFFGYSFEE